MKKRIILTVIVFCAIFIVASAIKVKAGTGENSNGWLWGGGAEYDGSIPWDGTNTNVGWISMNSTNCDPDNDGITEGGATDNPTYPFCPSGIATKSYGVTIPSAGGLTGYVWSANLGYIDFNPQDHCITTGSADDTHYKALSCKNIENTTGGVTRNGNSLTGWARIVDIAKDSAIGNSGGWSGWIKFGKGGYYIANGVNGVVIDADTGELSGYAFAGGDELGWIKVDSADGSGCPPPVSYHCSELTQIASCSDPANCGIPTVLQRSYCENSCNEIVSDKSLCGSALACPDEAPVTCNYSACIVHTGTWREVAP